MIRTPLPHSTDRSQKDMVSFVKVCLSPYRIALLILLLFANRSFGQTESLEAELQRSRLNELAEATVSTGDANRGAIVFHHSQQSCSKCHKNGSESNDLLGPNLAKLPKDMTNEAIVESVLYPSKSIRKGFESISVITSDGKVLTGLLSSQTDNEIVLKDVSRGGELVRIDSNDIEQIKKNELSLMPAGQINLLNSRQQFLDLIRYLFEIRDGGAERASQLQPSPSLLTNSVPDYESHIDHAGLIRKWNDESLNRGQAIYQRVCANCHGTHDQPGSLPTSLRFAEGKFKNGSDPLSMYRTLTHGFGQMVPQAWMVPSQKYDVIHFIRERYLREHNPTQYVALDNQYLTRLPQGDSLGPAPSSIESWSAMDYGYSLTHTFEIPGLKSNFAYKGVSIRLDPGAGGISRGRQWMVFDTDTLRMAAGWCSDEVLNSVSTNKPGKTINKKSTSFIDWRGIQFNGEHGVHPRIVGQTAFTNSNGVGWANPWNGEWNDDQRVMGRDGKWYGPLPHEWGKYKGLYRHGLKVILSYSIGGTDILEMPRQVDFDSPSKANLLLRTFNIGQRKHDLRLQVADLDSKKKSWKLLNSDDPSVIRIDIPSTQKQLKKGKEDSSHLYAGFAPHATNAKWEVQDERLVLFIPAGSEPLRFSVWLPADNSAFHKDFDDGWNKEGLANRHSIPAIPEDDLDLMPFTKGGQSNWPQVLTTEAVIGPDDGPFAVDTLKAPDSNPWLAQMRFTGLDFFPDGRIAVCTWDGDVWIVTPERLNGIEKLLWHRVATGLFQPLGIKVNDDKIYLTCRDQLTVLHDFNGDGETDFYECFNNDNQVTEHFHEFAMGLQIDQEGNFYYAKSGCHGKAAIVPHHGTLLRVSRNGSRTDILANGFRAANGVCLNPDGSFFVTDQEGFWNPKNRINWVSLSNDGKPKFYGNMLGYHEVKDTSDSAMEPPLCWITNEFDRSPAELLWVDSKKWGALNGALLNLSYGYGKVFVVPHERINGKMQGGMIELPIAPFATGVMRGRFCPDDGQLYLCGMFAWAGNATRSGGLYRLRATGQPVHLPIAVNALNSGMKITFAEPLDPVSLKLNQISVKTWSLKRTANYGSKHFNEKLLTIRDATLSSDAKTLTLEIDGIQPTWCMEIQYKLRSMAGAAIQGTLHNTIHELGK